MNDRKEIVDLFKTKAELVSAFVSDVDAPEEALAYAVDLCARKEPRETLIPGAGGSGEDAHDRIMAAPLLTDDLYEKLGGLCKEKGIRLISEGAREYLAGMDVGFTFIDYGVAETGTLVLDSRNEEVRLATMISEIHVALLPKSRIRASAFELEEELRNLMGEAPGYLAFISGASRTADIERVLAIGVHGPLELHILLWEDQ
ncbi:MAG: lactate utilization protein [Desulfobacterales bacterium]|nr:lactate utilization protein [Desulfobacterales bacterium]